MANDADIKRYSAEQLREKRRRGESETDFTGLAALSKADIEQRAVDDPDSHLADDWEAEVRAVMPTPKRSLTLRVDANVLDWFQAGGAGYQTRMNAVLRAYVDRQKKRPA